MGRVVEEKVKILLKLLEIKRIEGVLGNIPGRKLCHKICIWGIRLCMEFLKKKCYRITPLSQLLDTREHGGSLVLTNNPL